MEVTPLLTISPLAQPSLTMAAARAFAIAALLHAAAAGTFTVAQDAFQLDGKNVTLLSGSIHYHRVHPALWRDRLARLRALGLNAIQT